MPEPAPDLSPEQLEALLKQIEQMLERIWNQLTPEQRARLEAIYLQLRAAVQAARAGGPAMARETLLAILEKLQEFIGGLMREAKSWFTRDQLRWLVSRIYEHIRAMTPAPMAGAGGAGAAAEAAGAGGAAAGGLTLGGILILILWILAAILGLVIWGFHVAEEHDKLPTHVAGPSCGNPLPVATGLREWDISVGTLNSWENLMAKMRKRAAQYPCTGACASGKCTGNPAVMDFDQTRMFLATYSWARFDVYCECLT